MGPKNSVIDSNEKFCGKMLYMLCYQIEIIRMNFITITGDIVTLLVNTEMVYFAQGGLFKFKEVVIPSKARILCIHIK